MNAIEKLIDDIRGWWYFASPAQRADAVIGVVISIAIVAIVAYEAWGRVL